MDVDKISDSDIDGGNDIVFKLPRKENGLEQDEEYGYVVQNGSEKKIMFHDYHEIYEIPGLYEHIFYEVLECKSPRVVTSLLKEEVVGSSVSMSDLVVLDFGAGNGMVGEALKVRGVESLVGVDIIEEAAMAAERDRPDLYDGYYVEDLCELSKETQKELEKYDFNCLVTVAALGFGDIPPLAFAKAYNLVSEDGFIAFNIKEDFVDEDEDSTGFQKLLKHMTKEGVMQITSKHQYQHRLSVEGESLYYIAMVARKETDTPAEDWIIEC